MTEEIPDCNELFLRYFAPRYTEWQVKWHDMETTRADLAGYDDLKGQSVSEISPLESDSLQEYTSYLNGTFTEESIRNIGEDPGITHPVSMNWIEQIDQYYDISRIAQLIRQSDPTDENNLYFQRAIEIGAIIAVMLQRLIPDLAWYPDPPYWEAGLWHAPSGQLIPPTHWAIKKLSAYGHADGLAAKIYAVAGALDARTARQ